MTKYVLQQKSTDATASELKTPESILCEARHLARDLSNANLNARLRYCSNPVVHMWEARQKAWGAESRVDDINKLVIDALLYKTDPKVDENRLPGFSTQGLYQKLVGEGFYIETQEPVAALVNTGTRIESSSKYDPRFMLTGARVDAESTNSPSEELTKLTDADSNYQSVVFRY